MRRKNKKGNQNVNADALNFMIREAYKTARTNIDYSIIKKGCKKVLFTSSSKGEGKTLSSVNIASALAQQVDTKVIIVECDLRRPHVHLALNLTPSPGLANCLNGECDLDDIIKPTHLDNLFAICYGAIPPNPSELLSSDSMTTIINRLSEEYDYVIFDAPPVGVVIDAVPIIKQSDGVVLVIRNNSTTYPQLNKTIDTINRSGGKTLGVIVNRVKSEDTRSGKYSYNYNYRYE
ncbi:MAG: CpsD/CapB family tyrosine-protein kinase [Ruminococcus sp.]|nr:CpsD/CapB family tyrosine-protein kinase [Ruminococcus sp.]